MKQKLQWNIFHAVEHISWSATYLIKCKFDSIACNSNKKWNNETGQCECKNY